MKHAGIWVDHERAVIVELATDGSPTTRTIASGVERRVKSQGESRRANRSPHAAGVSHRHLAERRRNALRRFYRDLADALAEADEVVILGPGLARKELAAELRTRNGNAPRLRAVLPSSELSRAALCAKVRQLFGYPAERLGPRHVPRKVGSRRPRLVRLPRAA